VGAFRTLVIFLFVLSIPTALATSTIRFLANEPRVYRYAIDEFGAVAASGIERAELIRASSELIAYFRNDADTVNIRVQAPGREVPLFTSKEVTHLKDVKDRFQLMNRVQEFSVMYLLTYLAVVVLWGGEVSGRALASQVAAGSLLTLAVLGAIGGLGLSGFNSGWERFHEVLFSNDFWRLDPRSDHLIQMFPLDFWQNIVFFAGLLIVAQAALVLLVAGIYLGVTHRPAARQFSPSFT
jgi:integral membrane protein (TIGR01906 family)